jgi:Leucine-rich repeat (LRR) protein
MPAEILKCVSLESIDLSETDITQLPPEISQLQNLHFLYLDNTRIKRLPVEMRTLTKLGCIFMRESNLLSQEKDDLQKSLPNIEFEFVNPLAKQQELDR